MMTIDALIGTFIFYVIHKREILSQLKCVSKLTKGIKQSPKLGIQIEFMNHDNEFEKV